MASNVIVMRVVFRNRKAIRAMRKVVEVINDVAEDMPWRDDVKQAVKAGRYAIGNMQAEFPKRKD
jgi:hypothetical protein